MNYYDFWRNEHYGPVVFDMNNTITYHPNLRNVHAYEEGLKLGAIARMSDYGIEGELKKQYKETEAFLEEMEALPLWREQDLVKPIIKWT